MLGIVDRIEDGEIAVIKIRGGGELIIPITKLPLKVYEGAFLHITISLDQPAERKQKKKIKALQTKLLRKKMIR